MQIIQADYFKSAPRVVDVSDIRVFNENSNIYDICFQNSDSSNIDTILSELPNLTHLSFPKKYYSDSFTRDNSPLDNCSKLEVIKFFCNVDNNMEYLGNHLAKLQNLKEIYFFGYISNKVFKNMSYEVKKFIVSEI